MKLILFIPLIFLTGCLGSQSFNSNSNDFNLTASSSCADPTNTNLCNAMTIIQRDCFECHGKWSSYDTDTKWIDSNFVIAGDPDRSELITYLKNAGGNMPENKAMLSDEDYQALRDWISGIP